MLYSTREVAEILDLSMVRVQQLCSEHGVQKLNANAYVVSAKELGKFRDQTQPAEKPQRMLYSTREVAEILDLSMIRVQQLCAEHGVQKLNANAYLVSAAELSLFRDRTKSPGRPRIALQVAKEQYI